MKIKRNKIAKGIVWTLTSFSVALTLLSAGLYIYARKNVDYSRDEMLFDSKKCFGASRLYYFDEEGNAAEYAAISPSDCKQIWYSYSDIPEVLKNAFISTEDRNFFTHNGVDIKRTAYATLNYLLKMRSEFGGSTITQQVIKNISGDNEHSAIRKINEILRAIHIEDVYSKEEIFEVYLNIVPMGEGICGIGYASQHYFGKEPEELTIDEAAVLVGITNAPSRYDPYRNYEACLEKRNRVLYSMLDNGAISRDVYEEVILRDIPLSKQKKNGYAVDSWFTETVFYDVSRDLAQKLDITENAARILLQSGAYSIYTTVDPTIQEFLENYFSNSDNFPNAVDRGLDFSMIMTDSESGAVVGIVGAVGEKKANRIINGANIAHTPGSALKPLALYAPILEKRDASWSTVFDDSPVTFYKNSDGEYIDYPKNSPRRYDGLITLADALMLSKNTVAARIYAKLGKDHIYNTLIKNYGFDLCDTIKTDRGTLTDKALAPLALGQLTYGVSLRELTGAYSAFVSDGSYREPITYTKVTDVEGQTVLEKEQAVRRVMRAETARIMNQMLSRVVEQGTASAITLNELYDTAGKTGTSGSDKDRLFIGYTPYYTAGIRCGYKNGTESIGKIEKTHLEIWDEIMNSVHTLKVDNNDNVRCFSIAGLERLPYCKDSGELFSDNCLHDPRGSRLDYGYFTHYKCPSETCGTHVLCEMSNMEAVSEDIFLVSLLDIPKREFPIEIEIGDSKYLYSDDDPKIKKVEHSNFSLIDQNKNVTDKKKYKRQ